MIFRICDSKIAMRHQRICPEDARLLGPSMSFHVAERDTTTHENMSVAYDVRSSAVRGSWHGADEPAHEFDPGHQFGTTDCDPLRRSTRGRNCFFRCPDRRDLDQEAGKWKYFTRDAAD